MPKRISKPKKTPRHVNQNTLRVVQESTREAKETPAPSRSLISQIMAEMGRKGGKIGGKRRLETMTPAERSKVGLKAAQTRWAKAKKKAS